MFLDSYIINLAMKRNKKLRRLSILTVYILVIGGFLSIFLIGNKFDKKKSNMPAIKHQSKSSTSYEYKSVSGNYLFSGTVMLGRAIETYAMGDYNQPFSGMSTLGSYDANIGVLECPITNNVDSYQNQVTNLLFNCSPKWLPTLKKYFPILDLSSNHLYDQTQTGYNTTVNYLTSAGFQTVGNFNPHIEKDDCKAIALPIKLQKDNNQSVSATIPVAMCSYNYKTIYTPSPGELESIQKWSKLMPVIGMMNGGPEYMHTNGPDQANVAHKMIDYGASFVLGNGTHWVQNTEVYKGKLIEYSMGNFIFDQLDYDGRIALNVSVAMSFKYDDNVAKWIANSDSCKNNSEGCLSIASTQNLSKINPKFIFGAVGSYGGYLQVATKASPSQQADIESRATWSSSMKLLGQ
jgi:poly-gamma-glutamate synthesis protein (capsule biosynthesis protein)